MWRGALAALIAVSIAAPVGANSADASPIPHPPELWVMDADGSDQRRLYPAPDERSTIAWSSSSWSPHATEIAFVTYDEGGEVRIFDLVASSTRTVLSFRAQDVSWSPNGEWLALTSLETPRGVYLVRPDGSGLRHIGPDAQVLRPVWAPDGSRLAVTVVTEPGQAFEVAVIEIDGSHTVLARDGHYTSLTWSPDGTRIAYIDRDGRLGIIATNGAITKITPPGPQRFEPAWSPDGSKIAFVEDARLVAVNPDGSGRIELARGWNSPRWSPDGTQVAFSDSDDIFRVARDATGLTNLTNTEDRFDHHFEWSPNGSLIAFLSEPKPFIPPDETYGTSISLRARGHLTLRGRITTTDGEPYQCAWREPRVVIERRRPWGWDTVTKVRATTELARFRAEIRDREGRFRARVRKVELYGVGGNKITCLADASDTVIHRH